MELSDYLERIGYKGTLKVNLETLTALHRAHLFTISYENLDIHLGRRLTVEPERIFDKIVNQGRGGWCYEMNGLFGWALKTAGFDVTLHAGGVGQQRINPVCAGNHLVLVVQLDRPYLVDVGFGNGFWEPLPLEEGDYPQHFLDYHLRRDGDYWVFQNHKYDADGIFDFTMQTHQMSDFAAKCDELQTSPASFFTQLAVCYRILPDKLMNLRGAVLRTVTAQGVTDRTIESQQEYVRVLDDQFDLHIDEAASLWPTVWERHLAWKKSLES